MAVNNVIKVRRGTASDWTANPVLAQGEPGFDTTNNILKIGDGTTNWNSLVAVNNSDHPNISAAGSVNNTGNTFVQDITVDSNGHITSMVSATASEGGSGGIGNVVEDTTPQLGGNLDLNSKIIDGTGAVDITGSGHFSSLVRADSFIKDGGTSSQFLKADGSVDTSTYLTDHPNISAASSSDNSGRTYIQDIGLDSNGHVTSITTATETVTDTNTQLTEEQVEDFVGGMVTGNTETGITVTYDDTDGTLDFVVASQTDENFTTADHSKLDGIEAGADVTDTTNVTAAGALMDSELTDLAGVKGVTISTLQPKPSEGAFANGDKTKLDGIEASADVTDTANVTSAGALMDSEVTNLAQVKAFDSSDYATAAQGTKADSAQQPPAEGAFVDGDKTKLDGIETGATADQTDEEIQDIVGAMLTGNTETGITVTYQDADGTIDFAVASQTDENFTTADHSKLDGIEANADVTDTTNVTAAGALMDSELTDLAGVKGVTISTLQPKPSEGAFANGDKTKLDGIEANATADQTDEEIQDIVGAMLSGNTETGITVTYQDADGTIDFVVASQTDENFTTADHSKLDGIEASADVTDTANVTAAGALMDSELTDLAGVKGVTISTLQVKPSEGAFANGDKTKLDGIEASADVTDATNVDAAGAVMNSDSSTASMSFVVDEDNMASDSATKVPTQQSVKAYVDANAGGGGGGSMTTVKANGSQVGGADIVTLDFATDFTIGETPDTEINISIADGAITSDKMTTSTLVLNEAGAAVDFRVEGDTEQNLLFVDGSADKVGIGTNTPAGLLHIKGEYSAGAHMTFEDTSSSLKTRLYNGNSASVIAVDEDGAVGSSSFIIQVDNSNKATFGASATTFDQNVTINSTNNQAIFGNSITVLNEGGADIDFRVEGDTDTDLIYANAGLDKVGIGLSAPTEKLDVDGNIKGGIVHATSGLNVGVSGLIHQSGTLVHSTHAAWGEFPGNAQNSINLLTGETTNATFTSLEMNNGMYSGVKLPSNKTFFADVNIVGRRTNASNSTSQHAAYQLKACINNDGFGRSIIGSVNKTVIAESNSAWDVQLAFAGAGSGQTDYLLVQCKGAASTNVHWVAKVDLLEVGGLNEASNYREANIYSNMTPELIP